MTDHNGTEERGGGGRPLRPDRRQDIVSAAAAAPEGQSLSRNKSPLPFSSRERAQLEETLIFDFRQKGGGRTLCCAKFDIRLRLFLWWMGLILPLPSFLPSPSLHWGQLPRHHHRCAAVPLLLLPTGVGRRRRRPYLLYEERAVLRRRRGGRGTI